MTLLLPVFRAVDASDWAGDRGDHVLSQMHGLLGDLRDVFTAWEIAGLERLHKREALPAVDVVAAVVDLVEWRLTWLDLDNLLRVHYFDADPRTRHQVVDDYLQWATAALLLSDADLTRLQGKLRQLEARSKSAEKQEADAGKLWELAGAANPEDLEKVLTHWLTLAAEAGGQGVLDAVGLAVSFRLNDTAAEGFLQEYALSFSAATAKGSEEQIRKALLEAVAQGRSIPETAEAIEAVHASLYRYQSERIARTEIVRAHTEGEIAGLDELDVQRYQWLTAEDERTCPECGPLDGHQYPVNGDGPRPPLHPNCRCTVILPDDEFERLRGNLTGLEPLPVEEKPAKAETATEPKAEPPQDKREAEKPAKQPKKKPKQEANTEPAGDPAPQTPVAAGTVPLNITATPEEAAAAATLPDAEALPAESRTAEQARGALQRIQERNAGRLAELTEEMAARQSEWIAALQDGSDLVDAAEQRANEAATAHASFREQVRQEMREKVLYADTPGSFAVTLSDDLQPEEREAATAAAEALRRMLGPSELDGETLEFTAAEQSTPGYRGKHEGLPHGAVLTSPGVVVDQLVHEAGHWLEDYGDGILKRAEAWWRGRTKGERTRPLPGFGQEVVGRRDKFTRAYTGRVYQDEKKIYATEVVSTGLEQLWRDPWQFAQDDPDHFDFIWSLLRGTK